MAHISATIPYLAITDPVWLSLFRKGWEDPEWGRRPIGQHAIALTLHQLAALVTDGATRNELRQTSAKMLIATSQQLAEESVGPHSA